MAAIGSAIGLGNLWRFPYLCYKWGGAVFFIPYLLSLFALGLPMMMLEFALGQVI
jgi:neurotransmitter:Na+ symporter, NSS family